MYRHCVQSCDTVNMISQSISCRLCHNLAGILNESVISSSLFENIAFKWRNWSQRCWTLSSLSSGSSGKRFQIEIFDITLSFSGPVKDLHFNALDVWPI